LATVGTDPITSSTRFTFGSIDLTEGINLAPLAVGLFGMSEVLRQVAPRSGWPKAPRVSMRQAMPTRQQWKDALPAAGRGSIVGFFLGALPGPSLILGSFSSHALETWLRKRDDAKGPLPGEHQAKRRVQGVAGPKAADDAAVGGNLIPLLTLGIPFTGITAVLLAAFLLHNVHPGPQFVQTDPAIFWGLVVAMYLGNIMLVVLNVPLAGLWIKLLNVPASIRLGVLVSIMTVGVYSIRDSMFDVWTLFVFGLVGFGLRSVGINRAYLILGFVLSPIIEANVIRALQLSGGSTTIFLSSPVSAVAVSALVLVLVVPSAFRLAVRGRRRAEAPVPRSSAPSARS
jgi:putative tricarboxylic transport membrane protein